MKRHWCWRLTHSTDKDDRWTFRSDESYRRMLAILTKDGVVEDYKRERVLVLR